MAGRRGLRNIRAHHVVLAWLVVYFPWLPGWPLNHWLPNTPFAWVVDANLAAEYAIIAISLVILTGWVGQISLGQGAFVGIGAFTAGLLSRHWGIPFPVSIPIVAAVSAGVAAALGVVALRVRGLYLAVATLIFAWVCDAYLFSAGWFVGEGGATSLQNRPIGDPRGFTFFDFAHENTLYLVLVAAVAAVWFLAVNLRDSKTGRAFFAIRGSEMAAVSLGIDVIRYKLLAFALSGGLAGIAGNLMIVDLQAASPTLFQFTVSFFFVGIAVVGGITSLGGAVAAGILFAGLSELFRTVKLLDGWLDVVTIGLLLGVLLAYPGGLGALGPALAHRLERPVGLVQARLRDVRAFVLRLKSPADFAKVVDEEDEEREAPAVVSQSRRRRFGRALSRRTIDLEAAHARTVAEANGHIEAPKPVDWRTVDVSRFTLPKQRSRREAVLEAENIVVKFGGLTAVDNVGLEVREHEIVGLIGPNGAGKTTTFNAIAGLNEPTSGTIKMFGEDVTRVPVHVRAQMGMGRTFQIIQLFPELTVFQNILVATHAQNPTGVGRHLLLTDAAIRAEARARKRVRLIIEMLGLEELTDRRVSELPFGILRQVEIARALVTGSPLLMLDEPASGLDNAETDELARLLRYLRAELSVSILLIEHDVRMVTSVSDYMYVVNRGKLLAEGPPATVQQNPEVIAAYLGRSAEETREREKEPVG